MTSSEHSWRLRSSTPFQLSKREAVASQGMVVSNHPLASAAGVETMVRGGNAMDAAVATVFALTVVEPMMVGIFGAGHTNFWDNHTRKFWHIDNYAVAPLRACADMYQPVDEPGVDPLITVGRKNELGHLAVGVGGTLKGWIYLLERFGRLGLKEVMAPAIRYAEDGFRASQYLCDFIAENREDLARYPETAKTFLPDDVPMQKDHLLRQPDYAQTLRQVAEHGDGFLYGGPLGRALVEDMAQNGGIITMEDLERYQMRLREPVRGIYRGYEVVSLAPPSSGGTHIIQGLNLLESFDVAGLGYGTVKGFHLMAEVLKVCFADRTQFMGDPDAVSIPLAGLLSKDYARERVKEIDLAWAQAMSQGQPARYGESANTTHLTVADAEGNLVAMTQTIHAAFGSKATVPGTGMILNNTMWLFDPHPGRLNSVASGKRMLSSMSPTIVLKGGKPFMALGIPGGVRIFPAVLQAIVNVIDHGMSLQEAVEAPRIWTQGEALEVEEDVGQMVRQGLAALGHQVQVVPRVAGGMNGVLIDPDTGLIHGAACWRADGTPMGYSGGWARPGIISLRA